MEKKVRARRLYFVFLHMKVLHAGDHKPENGEKLGSLYLGKTEYIIKIITRVIINIGVGVTLVKGS
jgi:hypothetical protein